MKMFVIKYRKWSYNGSYVGEKTTSKRMTKRQAMAHLEHQGFERSFNINKKLASLYTKGMFSATIMSVAELQ